MHWLQHVLLWFQYEQPAPITTPIFGMPQPSQPEQAPPGAPMNYGNYGNYGNIYNPQEHQPVQQVQLPCGSFVFHCWYSCFSSVFAHPNLLFTLVAWFQSRTGFIETEGVIVVEDVVCVGICKNRVLPSVLVVRVSISSLKQKLQVCSKFRKIG